MTTTPTTKVLVLVLAISIVAIGVYFKTQNQMHNKVDGNLLITPNTDTTQNPSSTIIENQDIDNKPSCRDIPKSTNPAAGITYLESYCMGSYCQPESTKESCEAVDVVTVSGGELNPGWSKDNVGDCIWAETATVPNQCQVKYN